jgi:hypothetical protein
MSDDHETAGQPPSEEPRYEIDQEGLQAYMADLERDQSMVGGIFGGLAGAAIGAAAWALITVATEREFALVAIGIGLLAGFGVRLGGKGISTPFGVVGAVFAFLGCLVGKLLAIAIILSKSQQVPLADVVLTMLTNPGMVIEILTATFHPLDLLFYGIALYEGYRFSFRKITQEEVARFIKPVSGPPGASEAAGPTPSE